MWTRLLFDVETFIEAVKERPALYSPQHQNYNRKDIRARLWDEIGQIMYPEWGSFDIRDKNEKGSLMQKKWKSLKDCFNREIRLQKTRDPHKLRKKYEFYDRLSFLLQKHNSERSKPIGCVEEVKIKVEKFENSEARAKTPPQSLENSFQQPIFNQNQIKTRSQDENFRKRKVKSEEFLKGAKSKQQKMTEEAEESDRLFLMSFVNDLKKLPLATKSWVKMKFSEIMHQAAISLDGFQEVEYASTSVEYEQEADSPGTNYAAEYSKEGNSPYSPSSEIYDICHD